MADQAPPETSQNSAAENAAPVFPEKIRVHALAKMLGLTSKQVLAQVAEFGAELRSAQSSVDRALAERVHAALAGPTAETPAVETPAVETPAVEAPAVEPAKTLFTSADEPQAHVPVAETAPVFQAPLFLQPEAEAAPASPLRCAVGAGRRARVGYWRWSDPHSFRNT
ncbi:translation initiation factor IF-2 N-terminal domain-containing protein, partial [Rhodococcus sp. NPDC059234]|uniref:translation initiation factor IF-2 N-terminal domain-containing protein n=1 Tax=Rhodococcus sp. NPDC059234 TaxID=3346781 RepID=UPI00367179F3